MTYLLLLELNLQLHSACPLPYTCAVADAGICPHEATLVEAQTLFLYRYIPFMRGVRQCTAPLHARLPPYGKIRSLYYYPLMRGSESFITVLCVPACFFPVPWREARRILSCQTYAAPAQPRVAHSDCHIVQVMSPPHLALAWCSPNDITAPGIPKI